MKKRPARWDLQGPPEGPNEGTHVSVVCSRCGNAFGEYRLVPDPGLLLPVGHERNELASEPGWVRVGQRHPGGRGPLTGAGAYAIEESGGKTYLRWSCGGRYETRCRSKPKIEWLVFIKKVRGIAARTLERPIEIRL